MSDTALSELSFLPKQPPKQAILDYSGTLSVPDVARLEQQAHGMQGMKAKVVIMPKDFTTTDFDAVGTAIAKQWKVGGERMLVVVDLKDHKVRMYPGHQLEAQGLTPQILATDIIPHYFTPFMKRGDLTDAIHYTLAAAQTKVASASGVQTGTAVPSTSSSGSPYQAVPAQPQSHGIGGFWIFLGILGVVAVGTYMLSYRSRIAGNKKLADEFKQRVGPLYEKADQIGAASEYLQTKEHPELAGRVAQFFNNLTTLEKAVTEVTALEKQNKVWQVRDGYLRLMRMVGLMDPEADALKQDVNAVTGGVDSLPPPPKNNLSLEAKAQEPDAGQRVQIPERFRDEMVSRRPTWTYEPAYAYQPMDSGMSNLMMLGMMINQMETNRRLDNINWQLNHNRNDDWQQQQQQDSGSGLFGGFFGGGSGGGGFDAGWGDNSSGGGFGDAGGDWGGGGDSGGGDFGSSGGDW